MIPRLYDPDSGNIFFNSSNIRNINLNKIRTYISYVGQDFTLFNDTIYNNIAYGELSSLDAAKVYEAASLLMQINSLMNYLKNIIQLLVKMAFYYLEDRDRELLLQERWFKNAPILLLDEATSALDTESETLIQQSLARLSQNKTTLIIAHRLSTIINADKIIVIDDGRILEQGKHKELMDKEICLFYAL